MKVVVGVDGLTHTYQDEFPENITCIHCGKPARIGFVAHELESEEKHLYELHKNEKGHRWLHDSCCVAVYFCNICLEPTARYNQA